MKQQQHLFTNKMLRALLVPIIMEQLLNALMGTVDTMMVSNVGSAAISAVSLVDSINVLIIQAFSALAAGGTIICTQYLGQKNHEMANKSARQALFIITAISVFIVVLGLAFRAPLLSFIFGKVDADVMENSMVYFFYTVLSYPFIALYDAGASIFRAQENTRGPMVISIISNVMNIVGNGILIWVFHMGVAGAAISTLVSRIFCAVVVLYQLRKNRQPIVVRDYLKIRPDGKMIGRILALGIPFRYREQHVPAWKAGNPVYSLYTWNHCYCSPGYDQYAGDVKWNSCNWCWNRTYDSGGSKSWSRKKRRGSLLHEKTDGLFGSLFDHLLCSGICPCTTDYHDRWNGSQKRRNVSGYDVLDHHCETNGMDVCVYPGLRHACSRRCEVFHDYFLHYYVDLPLLPVRLSDPGLRHGTDGCLDRNVYRLDGTCDRVRSAV